MSCLSSWDVHSIPKTVRINREKYNELVKKFGGKTQRVPGDRSTSKDNSTMVRGDPNDTIALNGAYIEPVTANFTWTNRVKAAPTAFSFAPPDPKLPLYEYPENSNMWRSDRLLGLANVIDTYKFDQMMAQLGPFKKVNVIIIGFGDLDASIAQSQRAKWIGGRKNDVVICYGGHNNDTTWAEVFGWTQSELCKQNLKTIFLENKINNDILPLIRNEIVKNYEIKDWSEFDYITVEPPVWSYWAFIAALIVTQGIAYIYCYSNEFEEYEPSTWGFQNRMLARFRNKRK